MDPNGQGAKTQRSKVKVQDSRGQVHACDLTFLGIGDLDALAVLSSEGPAVEGALDAVATDLTPDPQVGPKMRAVGIHYKGLTTLPAENDQLMT